jgi:hypothetical protein
MANVKGMLSFLDKGPEEYARLFSQETDSSSLPQSNDNKNLTDNKPDSNLHPGSNLMSGINLVSESNLYPDNRLLPGSRLQPTSSLLPECDQPPTSKLPTESNLLPGSDLHTGASAAPVTPFSESPSRLLPGSELRTARGRIVKIRIAKSVQDAHTPGEHGLLTAMWRKASPETAETRLLKAGLADLAYWTGAHKTRCREYIRALIAKLAIEEVETYNAAAGREGARVYRVFSFNAVLERRRRANLTHVIRTGAVWFVDPRTGSKLLPGSNLPAVSNLHSDTNLLSGSSLHGDPGSSLGLLPSSNLPPLIKEEEQEQAKTSSLAIVEALQKTIGHSDDAAVRLLLTGCRQVCSDAREAEVVHFIMEHGPRYIRMKGLGNPMGMLIRHLPKCFEGESFRLYREKERQRREDEAVAQAQFEGQQRAVLDDPNSSDEDREFARQFLGLEETK